MSINSIIGMFGDAVNWFTKKILIIILFVGLYYAGKFGWKYYKKYIFGTEYDFLSRFMIRVSLREKDEPV